MLDFFNVKTHWMNPYIGIRTLHIHQRSCQELEKLKIVIWIPITRNCKRLSIHSSSLWLLSTYIHFFYLTATIEINRFKNLQIWKLSCWMLMHFDHQFFLYFINSLEQIQTRNSRWNVQVYELLLMKKRKRFTKVPRRILSFIPCPTLL